MLDSYAAIRYFRSMKILRSLFVPVFLLLFSCNPKADADMMELWKQEILDVEGDFAAMAGKEGIPEAFIFYAAEDAVLMRGDQLFIGKQELVDHFAQNTSQPQDENLSWKPDFVDVSASGDLAYTYGPFTYSYTDSTGNTVEHKGVFHTVWKRQADGSWRFVWD